MEREREREHSQGRADGRGERLREWDFPGALNRERERGEERRGGGGGI